MLATGHARAREDAGFRSSGEALLTLGGTQPLRQTDRGGAPELNAGRRLKFLMDRPRLDQSRNRAGFLAGTGGMAGGGNGSPWFPG